jgi:hypothetical protein
MGQIFRVLRNQPFPPPLAAGGCDLADRDAQGAQSKPARNRRGDDGFADTGVGAGDEQAGDFDAI